MILAQIAATFRAGNFQSSATGGNSAASHTNSLRLRCVNCNPRAFRRTIQLTDGGPSATPELPSRAAGPPFGGAAGSAPYLVDSSLAGDPALSVK